jgi:hypothetical protein
MAAVSPSRAPLTHFTVWDAQKFRINRSIGHASSASLTQPVHTRQGRRARVERLPPGNVRSLSRLNRRRQPLLATLHWLLSSVFCATLREARLVSIASGFLLAPKKKPRRSERHRGSSLRVMASVAADLVKASRSRLAPAGLGYCGASATAHMKEAPGRGMNPRLPSSSQVLESRCWVALWSRPRSFCQS